MLKKIQETSGDVFAQLLSKLIVMKQRRESKESLAGPKRVPIPKVG
jgi:hypothetical protein